MSKSKSGLRNTRLTDRDIATLQHARRYNRITVREAIGRLPVFENAGKYTVSGVLRRLISGGYLGRASLYWTRSYYYLTNLAAKVLGDPTVSCEPLREEPKVRAYAVLSFCCLGDTTRELLTRDEFQEFFPDMYRPGRRINFYIDTEGPKSRLAYLRVDFGRSETVQLEHLISYMRRDMAKMFDCPAAFQLAQADELQLTLLTSLPQKAQRLTQTINQLDDPLPVPVRVEVIPDLRELVAPIKR